MMQTYKKKIEISKDDCYNKINKKNLKSRESRSARSGYTANRMSA